MASIEPASDIKEDKPRDWQEIVVLVNTSFDEIVVKVNERRDKVLNLIKELQEKESGIHESIKKVEMVKAILEEQMDDNLAYLQQKTIAEFSDKLIALRKEAIMYSDYRFVHSKKEIDRALSIFGSLELCPNHYLDRGVVQVAFGILPDNLARQPARFSCDESLDLIALTDVPSRQIFLFSMKGDFIQSFGKDYFKLPFAVKIITDKELVVSDIEHQIICKVAYDRDKRTKPKISTSYEANSVTSLDYDKESDLIYATSENRCILILTRECKFVSKIEGFIYPQSLFIAEKEIFVLDKNNPALHVLSKSTHKWIRSIIPRGIDLQLQNADAFTLDQDGYILIGKFSTFHNAIQIYSPSGHLVHSFPQKEISLQDEIMPIGIYVTENKDVVVLSQNPNFPIQFF